MSAWIVSREHIDVLIRAREVFDSGYWERDFDRNEVGCTLWRENLRSVSARYPGDENGARPGPVAFSDEDVDTYEYRRPGFNPTAGEVFKAIACYEYQSCEHDSWDESDARKFCEGLREVVAASLYEGPWGWDRSSVSARRLGHKVPA